MGLPNLEDIKNMFKPAGEAQEYIIPELTQRDILVGLGEIYLQKIHIQQQRQLLVSSENDINEYERELMIKLQALTEN
jgi:hypothetical protein